MEEKSCSGRGHGASGGRRLGRIRRAVTSGHQVQSVTSSAHREGGTERIEEQSVTSSAHREGGTERIEVQSVTSSAHREGGTERIEEQRAEAEGEGGRSGGHRGRS